MKNNRRLIAALVALVAAIALFVGIYVATRPDTTQGAKTITVEVVFRDETSKTYTYHTNEEHLAEVLLAEKLVEGTTDQFGLFITTVAGVTADYSVDQSYWAIYVNDEPAALGASSLPVNDGDKFSLVYTVYAG